MEAAGPLQGEDYDALIDAFEGWQMDPRALSFDQLIAVLHLFKELWLNLVFAQWRNSDRLASRVECIGKYALDFEASVLIALTKNTMSLSYPKEVISVERHLLRLYELLTSPTKFSKKASTQSGRPRRPLLQKNRILGLFKNALRSSRTRERPSSPAVGFRPYPLAPRETSEKSAQTLLSSLNRPPPVPVLTPQEEPMAGEEQMYVLPAEQLRVMNRMQQIAERDIKLPQHWINYYLSTLDPRVFDGVPQWTSERLRTGWNSINVCILVLEQFVYCEGMQELKGRLAEAYFAWSGRALDALLALLPDPDLEKAELTVHLYSEYMFKLFLFFSYLSKGSPDISLRSAQLTTKTVKRLVESDVRLQLNRKTADAFLSSLYFLFTFMAKQVGALMFQNENPNAGDLFLNNYVKIALDAFLFVARAIGSVEAASPFSSGADKAKASFQGAIDSLDELTDLIVFRFLREITIE